MGSSSMELPAEFTQPKIGGSSEDGDDNWMVGLQNRLGQGLLPVLGRYERVTSAKRPVKSYNF